MGDSICIPTSYQKQYKELSSLLQLLSLYTALLKVLGNQKVHWWSHVPTPENKCPNKTMLFSSYEWKHRLCYFSQDNLENHLSDLVWSRECKCALQLVLTSTTGKKWAENAEVLKTTGNFHTVAIQGWYQERLSSLLSTSVFSIFPQSNRMARTTRQIFWKNMELFCPISSHCQLQASLRGRTGNRNCAAQRAETFPGIEPKSKVNTHPSINIKLLSQLKRW